jgi:hypothetical protein
MSAALQESSAAIRIWSTGHNMWYCVFWATSGASHVRNSREQRDLAAHWLHNGELLPFTGVENLNQVWPGGTKKAQAT